MHEQRRQILEMVAEAKVTVDEAERLIAALDREQFHASSALAEQRPPARPRYLRVLVETVEDLADGPARVNIRVPIQLLRAGVRLTSLIPPQALNQVNGELRNAGIPIDLSQLKPQHIEELIDHLADMTVDVDQADTKVQVFCE